MKRDLNKYLSFLKHTREGSEKEGQRCCSRGWVSVIKVDSDGASCQDVVCHVSRFLLLLLLPLLGRPARASPAALGAARGLIQRPTHEDAAVQEHLLRWGHSNRVSAWLWGLLATRASTQHSFPWHGTCPAPPSAAKTAAPSVSLRALSREPG